MNKAILDGYIGIKFEAMCIDKKLPSSSEEFSLEKNLVKYRGCCPMNEFSLILFLILVG